MPEPEKRRRHLEVRVEVLAERIAALDRLMQASLRAEETALAKAEESQAKRFESVNEFRQVLTDQQATFQTQGAFNVFAEQSRTDRENLHHLYSELRVEQQKFTLRTEMEATEQSLRDTVAVLQGSVNRLLITMLSSFVLLLVTALIYNLTHK